MAVIICKTQAELDAVPAPRTVIADAIHGGWEVRTGPDYQPEPTPRIIPTADYIDRFTAAEQLAITTLAYAGAGDAQTVLLLLKTQTRPEIDLDAQTLIAGLDYLVAKGAIAAGRPAQIRA